MDAEIKEILDRITLLLSPFHKLDYEYALAEIIDDLQSRLEASESES